MNAEPNQPSAGTLIGLLAGTLIKSAAKPIPKTNLEVHS